MNTLTNVARVFGATIFVGLAFGCVEPSVKPIAASKSRIELTEQKGGAEVPQVGSAPSTLSERNSAPMIVLSSGQGRGFSLMSMLAHKLVLIGTVDSILSSAHTPYNSQGALQHTVFGFRVSQVLKNEYGSIGK